MPETVTAPTANSAKRRDRRQLIVRIVSVIVTVALLAALVGEVEWSEFDQLLGRVALASWLGALLAYLALNVFRALRFRVLLDKDDTPWRLLLPITLYHNFLVRALPFKLGELSYIALLRSRLHYSMEEGLSSLFGARILELLIIVLVFASGVLTSAEALALERERLMLIIVVTFFVCILGLYFGGAYYAPQPAFCCQAYAVSWAANERWLTPLSRAGCSWRTNLTACVSRASFCPPFSFPASPIRVHS